MRIFNRQILYVLSSFLAGFAVMTVELVAGRIVAPVIGSSVFTWTSVIGITLLGLALGSYAGGKIADKTEWRESLPLVFLISSIFVSLIPTLAHNADFITNSSDSILKLNLMLSIYLFLFPTFAIGLIQPIILKKFALDFSKIGSEYGTLSFAWSAGGILGVFLTGFFFISNIGSAETVWLMGIVLFLVGFVLSAKSKKLSLVFFITMLAVLAIVYATRDETLNKQVIFEKETDYYYARVIDTYLPDYGDSRILALDFDFHSIESKQPIEGYTAMYPVFGNLKKEIENILVIGGGAYTMPKYFKNYYSNAGVSVAEIDPEMVAIGNQFFDLGKYDIQTLVGDVKMLTKKDDTKYDVIFGDAYNSFISVPWYLLTQEWNEEIKEKLNEGGVYAINFIGSADGEKSEFTNSVISTFKISFPNFYVFAFGQRSGSVQNIVLVGIKGDLPVSEEELSKKLSAGENGFLGQRLIPVEYFKNSGSVVLTDNFSPVEKLMRLSIEDYFPGYLFLQKDILSL